MNMKWLGTWLFAAYMLVPLQSLSTVQPADSPWPMYCHDLKRTGRSSNPGPSAPVLLWSYRTGYELSEGPPPVIGSDGRLYMGSDDSTVYSLLSNGHLNWSYRALNYTGYPLALGSDGRVYIGSMAHSSGNLFYSMNSNGSLSWSYETGESVFSGPAPGDTGRIYVGSVDRNLYAFDSDGSLYWSYQTGNWVNSSPALGNDEKIYMGSVDNNLYALDSDGSLYWSYETGKPIFSSPSILDGLERIYVGSDDNNIYTIDSGGSLYWSYTTAGGVSGGVKRSPSIGDDGETYAGSLDKRIYALNSSGTFRWSYETGDYIFSSPALDSDGRVYVGSNDNSLYAFTSTGALHWSFLTASEVGSAALGNAGQLCFASGDADRNIYFLGAGPGPTASPTITPTVTGTPTATASGTPAETPTQIPTETPTQEPTATPTPNYLELSVMANASGGYNFFPGEQVVLEWKTYEDRYGFKDVPCRVYLGAALDPLDEDTAVSVAQILRSGALFLFDSHLRPSRYTGGDIYPTYKNVPFPVPNRGSSGTISFRVPKGAAGGWVFAAAFIRTDNRQFPSEPPVEVSNGFTLE